MATLNHSTEEIPKELYIVREGKRNRVFWSYSRAEVYFDKLNIEYCEVRSPVDGLIAQRQVTVGQMVTANQTILNYINSKMNF